MPVRRLKLSGFHFQNGTLVRGLGMIWINGENRFQMLDRGGRVAIGSSQPSFRQQQVGPPTREFLRSGISLLADFHRLAEPRDWRGPPA
jgi:hypothetical protein